MHSITVVRRFGQHTNKRENDEGLRRKKSQNNRSRYTDPVSAVRGAATPQAFEALSVCSNSGPATERPPQPPSVQTQQLSAIRYVRDDGCIGIAASRPFIPPPAEVRHSPSPS